MDAGPEHSTPVPDSTELSVSSWNVNSVKVRLPLLTEYLKEYSPDVMLLQELKTENESFPALELMSAGYSCLVRGQKGYCGVAVLSKRPIKLITDVLPDAPDGGEQARYIEAEAESGERFISVYVPNGSPAASDTDGTARLEYKTAWLDALNARVSLLMKKEISFVLGGDFNVIETDGDVYDIRPFENGAFTVPAVRGRFRKLAFAGLTEAVREKASLRPLYTYWDYQAGARRKNDGIFLDRLFLSPAFADRLKDAGVRDAYRDKEKTSDHAPVWCSFFGRKELIGF